MCTLACKHERDHQSKCDKKHRSPRSDEFYLAWFDVLCPWLLPEQRRPNDDNLTDDGSHQIRRKCRIYRLRPIDQVSSIPGAHHELPRYKGGNDHGNEEESHWEKLPRIA